MRHLIAVILLAIPVQAAAQTSLSEVPAGRRLQVWPTGASAPVVGRLHHLAADSLVLGDAAGNRSFAVQSGAIDRIRVDAGRPRALWTVGGIVAGATVGILVSRGQDSEPGDIGGIGGTADGIANTLTGMLVGGTLGFVFAPRRWREVRVGAP